MVLLWRAAHAYVSATSLEHCKPIKASMSGSSLNSLSIDSGTRDGVAAQPTRAVAVVMSVLGRSWSKNPSVLLLIASTVASTWSQCSRSRPSTLLHVTPICSVRVSSVGVRVGAAVGATEGGGWLGATEGGATGCGIW